MAERIPVLNGLPEAVLWMSILNGEDGAFHVSVALMGISLRYTCIAVASEAVSPMGLQWIFLLPSGQAIMK